MKRRMIVVVLLSQKIKIQEPMDTVMTATSVSDVAQVQDENSVPVSTHPLDEIELNKEQVCALKFDLISLLLAIGWGGGVSTVNHMFPR
jgi:hypothetical protein